MVVTIIISIIVCFLSSLVYSTKKSKYLGYSFFILFLYLALRYDFGNDYMSYYELFNTTKETPWSEITTLFAVNNFGEIMEPGYIFLNKLFSTFSGFFLFIAFQSLIFCLVYYNFIKKYVPPKYYWLSLIILIIDTSLMVRSISGIRQSIAVFCFVYSIEYIISRQALKFYLLIVLAILFHSSALILLPLYFIVNHNKISRAEPFIYSVIYLVILFFGDFFVTTIEKIVTQLFPRYLTYFDSYESTLSTGLGVALLSIIYIVSLFTVDVKSKNDRIFYRMFAVFIIINPLSIYIPIASRLSLYFAPVLVVFLPQLLTSRKYKLINIYLICIFLLFSIYLSYCHYTSPIFRQKNYYYHSILSQIK